MLVLTIALFTLSNIVLTAKAGRVGLHAQLASVLSVAAFAL